MANLVKRLYQTAAVLSLGLSAEALAQNPVVQLRNITSGREKYKEQTLGPMTQIFETKYFSQTTPYGKSVYLGDKPVKSLDFYLVPSNKIQIKQKGNSVDFSGPKIIFAGIAGNEAEGYVVLDNLESTKTLEVTTDTPFRMSQDNVTIPSFEIDRAFDPQSKKGYFLLKNNSDPEKKLKTKLKKGIYSPEFILISEDLNETERNFDSETRTVGFNGPAYGAFSGGEIKPIPTPTPVPTPKLQPAQVIVRKKAKDCQPPVKLE